MFKYWDAMLTCLNDGGARLATFRTEDEWAAVKDQFCKLNQGTLGA